MLFTDQLTQHRLKMCKDCTPKALENVCFFWHLQAVGVCQQTMYIDVCKRTKTSRLDSFRGQSVCNNTIVYSIYIYSVTFMHFILVIRGSSRRYIFSHFFFLQWELPVGAGSASSSSTWVKIMIERYWNIQFHQLRQWDDMFNTCSIICNLSITRRLSEI